MSRTRTHSQPEGTAAKASKDSPPLPHQGDRVLYRCRGVGAFYPAKVLTAGAEVLAIEVDGNPSLTLSRVAWWPKAKAQCPRGACVPS